MSPNVLRSLSQPGQLDALSVLQLLPSAINELYEVSRVQVKNTVRRLCPCSQPNLPQAIAEPCRA